MKQAWERLHKKIDVVLDHIIELHREKLKGNDGNNEDKNGREDLVDVLLNLQKSSEMNYLIKPHVIKNIVMEIFPVGTDPSSTTIDWAFSEMLRNPRVLEKAQAEVRAVFKVREQDIQGLDGYKIPKQTKIVINIYAVGRDPEFWSDPESFVPERFVNSTVDFRGSSFEYIPFGGGRRICPGINFGIANIELPLAQLLYHFDWSLADGLKAGDLDMSETFGITSRRKTPLIMVAEPNVPFSYDGDYDK
ncbi:hypothetical protein NL676_019708 [Syzygium grande]|nr:hypothetical protein NL676_019708 [Syzygium grande]